MADWHGQGRTNYVKVADMEGLRKSLEPFDINIDVHFAEPNYVCLDTSCADLGSWPSIGYQTRTDPDTGDEVEDDVEFDFAEHVMPFIEEGEVLVTMECGAEKLRYLTGVAQAFVRRGDQVESVDVSMTSIYRLAAEKFGISVDSITEASYQDLPKEVEERIRAERSAQRSGGA